MENTLTKEDSAKAREQGRKPSLNDLLEDWAVHPPGMWDNQQGPDGWWAVSDGENGITAYFAKGEDAYRYRLFMVNRALNP